MSRRQYFPRQTYRTIGEPIKVERRHWNARGWILAITFLIAVAALILALLFWCNTKSDIQQIEKSLVLQPNASTRIVYVHSILGNDINNGREPADAVQTITTAIDRLGDSTSTTCIIQLLSQNTSFDLGTDPVLCFFPAVSKCKEIVIRGTRTNVVNDTVQSIVSHGPFDGWKGVQGNTGNYVANYTTHFVHNLDEDKIYVVGSHTTNTIYSIVGDLADYSTDNGGPQAIINAPNAWHVGQRLQLFQPESVLTWSGKLTLDVPFNHIVLESLVLSPSSTKSFVSSPRGTEHRVSVTGCRINVTSVVDVTQGSEDAGFFMGSYMLHGVYGFAGAADVALSVEEEGRCFISTSLWLDNVRSYYTGECFAHFFKSSGFVGQPGGLYSAMTVRSAEFRLFGAEFTGGSGARNYVLFVQGTTFTIDKVHMIDFISTVDIPINVESGGQGFFKNLNISVPNTVLGGMFLQESTHVSFANQLYIYASTGITVIEQATMIVNAFDGGYIGGRTGPAIFVSSNDNHVQLVGGGAGLMLETKNNVPIIHSGKWSNIQVRFNVGFRSPGPTANLIQIEAGHLHLENAPIVNQGTGNSLVKIGANNAGPQWTQDDYAHPSSRRASLIATAQPLDQTIYVSETGSNAASGMETDPVQTIQGAIDVLAQRSVATKNCVIQLQGATHNLGANPTLSFGGITGICDSIVIRGSTLVETGPTTISALGRWGDVQGPNVGNVMWRSADITGGLAANAFDGAYLYDQTTDTYMIIDNNDATTAFLVAGNLDEFAGVNERFEEPPQIQVGDTVILYTIESTISFSGTLMLDIPKNSIMFERVIIDGADDSTVQAPAGLDHKVALRGCRLIARSSVPINTFEDHKVASFRGSYKIEGCHAVGTRTESLFASQENGRCIRSFSFWLEATRIFFTDACSAHFFKASGSDRVPVQVESADFQMGAADIDSSAVAGFPNYGMGAFRSGHFDITGAIFRGGADWLFFADVGSVGNCHFCSFIGDGTARAIGIAGGSRMRWYGGASVTGCILGVSVGVNSEMDMSSFSGFPNNGEKVFTGYTTTPIVVTTNSKLFISTQLRLTTAIATPLFSIGYGAQLYYQGAAGDRFQVDSPNVVFEIAKGASMTAGNTLTQATNILSAGVKGDLVQCGGNAPNSLYTTENDLGAATPENCFFTR